VSVIHALATVGAMGVSRALHGGALREQLCRSSVAGKDDCPRGQYLGAIKGAFGRGGDEPLPHGKAARAMGQASL